MKKILLLLLVLPVFSFGQSTLSNVEKLLEQKEYEKAEHIMIDYVKNNPNDIRGIELLGDTYGYQKKWKASSTYFKMLIDRDNSKANYHFKYGGALGMHAREISKFSALGIIGDVKEAFLKAAELDPKHIETRWALVELYMQLPGIIGGSKNKALKYANQIEKLSKVDGYLAKGYIYENDDEPKLAEEHYKMAIRIGGSITCFNKLTELYEKTNEPNKAIANIEEAQKQEKLKAYRNTLHYQIGKVAARYNLQLDKGETCLKTYIENYSAKDAAPIEWAYLRLAQIYKLKKNKQEALNWADKAISIRSDFQEAKEFKESI
ncbi:hypothetical protein D7030_13795 [Flavobacteriaceae bacterium AU392]|nr:hypothetical protein D1817_04695 [Flavobacteriaceae bacterium]RKM81375.1 hypothetical protein D7030_13795 [Flavobacteriaceae bacterium AU392]